MTNPQTARANAFAALHVKGNPLILYNAWDPGSGKAIRDAGARAIATGSWSVAAANGYDDGEKIPLHLLIDIARRIVENVDVPVTLDFESGYARGGPILEKNVREVIDAGVIGINFEDQRIADESIYGIEEQASRIATARSAAKESGVPLFINARTDVFLRSEPSEHASHVDEAIERAAAYAKAGASGFFVPGLRDPALIRRICDSVELPVNVMFYPDLPPVAQLGKLGVARLSYGPRPYREMIAWLTNAARQAHGVSPGGP
jgi:2-methylisocitrate lyase-like PEP mutase family enzyme